MISYLCNKSCIINHNYSCQYCSFQVVDSVGTGATLENPRSIGLMGSGTNTTIQWNISAQGALNTTWDVLAMVNYTAAGWRDASTNATKVRIVEHPWWNTSFNCRKLVEFNISSGRDALKIFNFNYSDNEYCRAINCTKETRVTEVLDNASQVPVTNITVNLTNYQVNGSFKYCSDADVKFDYNQSGTHKFFVYYYGPTAEADYSPSINTNISTSYVINNTEQVWNWYYNSHIDFWWHNETDTENEPGGSIYFRNASINVSQGLKQRNFTPQISANRLYTHFNDRVIYDDIYWYDGHGGIANSSSYNQTYFNIQYSVFSDDVSTLPSNLSAKFAMVISSFGGDNSTTLTGCTLNNWLSKAFTDKKAECFLGFLGNNPTTICDSGCGSCISDVYYAQTTPFNACFWGNISAGKTILESMTACDNTDVHANLVNASSNSCNQTLLIR